MEPPRHFDRGAGCFVVTWSSTTTKVRVCVFTSVGDVFGYDETKVRVCVLVSVGKVFVTRMLGDMHEVFEFLRLWRTE